jgi:ribokinase
MAAKMASKTITIIGSLNMDLVTVTPYVPKGGETMTASSFSTGAGGKGANQYVFFHLPSLIYTTN